MLFAGTTWEGLPPSTGSHRRRLPWNIHSKLRSRRRHLDVNHDGGQALISYSWLSITDRWKEPWFFSPPPTNRWLSIASNGHSKWIWNDRIFVNVHKRSKSFLLFKQRSSIHNIEGKVSIVRLKWWKMNFVSGLDNRNFFS